MLNLFQNLRNIHNVFITTVRMYGLRVKLNDGNLMPIIGFGTGGFDLILKPIVSENDEIKRKSIRDAINCGYRHFDSAFMYKTEKILGDAVNEAISDGTVKREDIFFVTKVWPTYYSKGRVIKSAKYSIKQSGLLYLDLLLLHMPVVLEDNDEPNIPNYYIIPSDYDLMDVYKELEEVKRMGLAKSIGVSNFNSQQIERVVKVAEFIPVTNQVECHPFLNQEKLLKFCTERNITLTAYTPLGARNRNFNKPAVLDDETLKEIADKYSKTVAQVILRWQKQRGVLVIPGSSNKERLTENMNIFNFRLADEHMNLINSLNRNIRYLDMKKFGFDVHKEYPFKIEF